MERYFDIVVIGGGIVGSSVAYHLALRGHRSLALLEMGEVGSGATGQSAAMVMQQTGLPLLSPFAAESMAAYRQYAAVSGVRLEQTGSLLYSTTEMGSEALERMAAMQNGIGITTEFVSGDALRRWSHLETSDIRGGSFCASDGFVDPFSVLRFFTAESIQRGVTVLTNCSASGLEFLPNGDIAIQTGADRISAGLVVNAAGTFSSHVAEWAGVTLPVRCNKRHLALVRPMRAAVSFPISEDVDDEWYFRPAGSNVLMGVGNVEELLPPDTCAVLEVPRDTQIPSVVRAYVEHRVPWLTGCLFPNYWVGIRAVTDDGMPLIGRAAHRSNFIYCSGMSGFGVTNAPAWGRLVAALVDDDPDATRALRPFGLERFDQTRVPRTV